VFARGDGASPLGDGASPLGDGVSPLGDGVSPLGDGASPLGDGASLSISASLDLLFKQQLDDPSSLTAVLLNPDEVQFDQFLSRRPPCGTG
jgi:hypothetical protein